MGLVQQLVDPTIANHAKMAEQASADELDDATMAEGDKHRMQIQAKPVISVLPAYLTRDLKLVVSTVHSN